MLSPGEKERILVDIFKKIIRFVKRMPQKFISWDSDYQIPT